MTKANVTIRDEFCVEEKPPPCGMVIFGASGDLTGRKLIPALYNLKRRSLLPERFYVVGCSRTALSDDDFRKKACTAISHHCEDRADDEIREFARGFFYVQGEYDGERLYADLQARLELLDSERGTGGNHIFYLATPPGLYETIVSHLGACELAREVAPGEQKECERGRCARVVVEKPFGHDLASARAIDAELRKVLDERQIYRIDHYLGKETVQNILMFRFANSIFEPIWNRTHIDHVQITVAESVGVEHRAGYYDKAGALRDMFQNHMIQMLSLVAMEPPSAFEADLVRDEKMKLMCAIHPFPQDSLDEWIVRGQYEAGTVDGVAVPGYRREEGVDPRSTTETFVAARFLIDNKRWQGVPFYLRTGKRLRERRSEIVIAFKRIPHSIFYPIRPEDLQANLLVLNVQPDEGVSLTIQAKHPGPKLCMSALTMDFKYREIFGEDLPEAYERLLLDCMLGDQMLFNRSDCMQCAWELITPILERWRENGEEGLALYSAGSWGPPAADDLFAHDGRGWHNES